MIFETIQEWSLCREALLPAIEMTDGTHNEDDVLVALLTGSMKLWRKNGSGLVSEFCQFPRMKVLNLFLAGGRLEDIMSLEKKVERYAVANGCKRITMLAVRDGWQRVLLGSRKAGLYMMKDL